MNLNTIIQKSHALTLECIKHYEGSTENGRSSILIKGLMKSSITFNLTIPRLLDKGLDLDSFIDQITKAYNVGREVRLLVKLSKDSGHVNQQQTEKFMMKYEELLDLLMSWDKFLKDDFVYKTQCHD